MSDFITVSIQSGYITGGLCRDNKNSCKCYFKRNLGFTMSSAKVTCF